MPGTGPLLPVGVGEQVGFACARELSLIGGTARVTDPSTEDDDGVVAAEVVHGSAAATECVVDLKGVEKLFRRDDRVPATRVRADGSNVDEPPQRLMCCAWSDRRGGGLAACGINPRRSGVREVWY